MQLSRVVIAAIFFVIGALIAIPALTKNTSSSRASGSPSPRFVPTATATLSLFPTSRVSPTRRSVTPRPAHSTPSRSPSPLPAVPLKVSVGSVSCPSRTVRVTVTNVGTATEDYAIEQNGTPTVADRISPQGSRTTKVTVREDHGSTVAVTWRSRTVKSVKRTANCTAFQPSPKPGARLPHTGPEDAALLAKVATGAAAMLTGAIVFWYGCLWPRRRERVLGSEDLTT